MRIVNKIKVLIVGLMLMLAWFQISNQILFTHTHIQNGKFVIHAHPFESENDGLPVKQHHHNKVQLFFLDSGNLAVFQPFEISIPVLQPVFKITYGNSNQRVKNYSKLSNSNRAPPAVA